MTDTVWPVYHYFVQSYVSQVSCKMLLNGCTQITSRQLKSKNSSEVYISFYYLLYRAMLINFLSFIVLSNVLSYHHLFVKCIKLIVYMLTPIV